MTVDSVDPAGQSEPVHAKTKGLLQQQRLAQVAGVEGPPQVGAAQVLQGGRLLRRAEPFLGPRRHVSRVDHRPGERRLAVDAAQRVLERVVKDAAELHLRLGPRRQAEDEAVLVHLRATQVGVHLRVGEGSDRWCGMITRPNSSPFAWWTVIRWTALTVSSNGAISSSACAASVASRCLR